MGKIQTPYKFTARKFSKDSQGMIHGGKTPGSIRHKIMVMRNQMSVLSGQPNLFSNFAAGHLSNQQEEHKTNKLLNFDANSEGGIVFQKKSFDRGSHVLPFKETDSQGAGGTSM